jgi:hypothetical protein
VRGAPVTSSSETQLIQSRREVPQGFRSLAAATYRGSTVVFESQAKVSDASEEHTFRRCVGLRLRMQRLFFAQVRACVVVG